MSPEGPTALAWLRRARSNFRRAQTHIESAEILYEDYCFDAQQAAEKAIKAVLVHLNVSFPRTHSIVDLLTLVSGSGVTISEDLQQASALTRFAVESRYPGISEDVTEAEYQRAVQLAERVLKDSSREFRFMENSEAEKGFVPIVPFQHVREIVRQVDSIVQRVTGDPCFRVRLFGSWVVGNARPHSDIDIAIDGPKTIDPTHMADIRDACDRLPTLFTIDLVDLASAPVAFRESVRESAISVELL